MTAVAGGIDETTNAVQLNGFFGESATLPKRVFSQSSTLPVHLFVSLFVNLLIPEVMKTGSANLNFLCNFS